MTIPSRGGRRGAAPVRLVLAAAIVALASLPLAAEDAGASPPPPRPSAEVAPASAPVSAAASASAPASPLIAARGSETNLPLPRFVSLKAAEGNARRGPSLSHRIDWVFVRPGMPLEITGEYGHWRRVRDRDGAGGWVHYSLLSGARTVIVTEPMADLRARPEAGAPVVARAEAGVVAHLGDCGQDWCRVSAGGQRGWIEKRRLWGVGEDETRS